MGVGQPHKPRIRRASVSSCVKWGSNELPSPLPDCPISCPDPHPLGLRCSETFHFTCPRQHSSQPPPPTNCHPDRAAHPQAPPGQPAAGSPTGPARGARPGPVLTPAAAAVTADCSAARAERSRLRPICSRLGNSLDRSRGSVAEEAEWLCSSRLLRRTTIFPVSSPDVRGGRWVPV